MKFQVVVDRIEGDEEKFAVIEFPDCSFHAFPLSWLPSGVVEGLTLDFEININREGKND